jgi:uncharacterized repeat protein (TIGR01451 family)
VTRPTTVIILLSALVAMVLPAATLGDVQGPGLEVSTETFPTHIAPGGEALIVISVLNSGAANTTGPVTVTDALPPGLTAVDAGSVQNTTITLLTLSHEPELWDCSIASVVTCRNDPVNLPWLAGGGGSPYFPGEFSTAREDPQIAIAVKATAIPGVLSNHVTVAGGGAPSAASATEPITVSETPAPFGIGMFDGWFTNSDGSVDTQAGSHPYSATFVLGFNQTGSIMHEGSVYRLKELHASEQVRTVELELPPGLVGNTQAVPQCPRKLFSNGQAAFCPADTQVGYVSGTLGGVPYFLEGPIFNLVPTPGHPATFGFNFVGTPTINDADVRGGSDYGVSVDTANVAQRNVQSAFVTLWSDPGDISHAPWENNCTTSECFQHLPGAKPFLTLPTACGAAPEFRVRIHPWFKEQVTERASFVMHDANHNPVGLTGCEHLAFAPAITTTPDTAKSDAPTGLTVEVKPPIGGLSTQEGSSSADIQNTAVTLPAGLVINPGQAAGLQACPEGRPVPSEHRYGDALTTDAEREQGEEDNDAAYCPGASKIGIVTIQSPLLEGAAEKQFDGNVYVLPSNPPDVKLLVAASADGVNLKLVGDVHLCESAGETIAAKTCEAAGQLITTFEGTPELPFTVFKLSFSGGAQAALDTPAQCGTYTASADFTPWSTPFTPDFGTGASFDVVEGPGGGACSPSPLPFAPTMVAGSTTDEAHGFTSFSLLLQRGDGQQRIERLQFKAPPGLSGMLSQVPLCAEPQASQGTCSSASQIGHATVASGPGPYPLVIPQPGEPASPIYLTGPYQGAPFGLAIVTHVIAGPFDLGTIVTRARIEIDPHTAQITVTTDPLPQIVDGVPTDLRVINSVIDRPGFMFNPTTCAPSTFSGTAWGTPPPSMSGPGASATVSTPFQVGGCRELAFKPRFKASTSARTTRAGGASLHVSLAFSDSGPSASSQSAEANVAKVHVELPKALPSRLKTLQRACTEAQFAANPAGCPAESIVGHAVAHTPILPVPLEGPAYFVSHGGAKFPELIMVLQGYGVTIQLNGETFIDSKTGVTSSTFSQVPDAPVSSFELTLPEGDYSALAANGNLCKQNLAMPTRFVAQNGATLNQNTHIEVEGCPNALGVVSKKLRGRTLTLAVQVPARGTLSASGKGVSAAVKTSGGRERLELTLHATRHRKFRARVRLTFTPSSGKDRKKLAKVVTVTFRR